MKQEYLQAAGKPTVAAPAEAKELFRAGLKLLDAAAANITEAGAAFAQIDESVWGNLIADAPAPMRRTLSFARAVGEGTMIPQLATAAGEAAMKLRGMPVADQLKLWTNPVEMHAEGRTGRHAKYMRFVSDMESAEFKQAFEAIGAGRWKLRSYEEQKSWLAEQAKKDPEKLHGVDRPGRWAVRGGRVYLAPKYAEKGLTRKQLEGILKDLEDEA